MRPQVFVKSREEQLKRAADLYRSLLKNKVKQLYPHLRVQHGKEAADMALRFVAQLNDRRPS